MIQRIQTVYLLTVTGLLITAMCLPMGYFTDTMGEHPFKALGMDVNGAFQSTWGLFGILMLSTIVAFATIFLYKNRMLQIRMSIFNSLLLVGYYILISDDYLNLSAALTITSSRPIERIASIFRMIETRGKQSAQPIRKRFSSFFNAK